MERPGYFVTRSSLNEDDYQIGGLMFSSIKWIVLIPLFTLYAQHNDVQKVLTPEMLGMPREQIRFNDNPLSKVCIHLYVKLRGMQQRVC